MVNYLIRETKPTAFNIPNEIASLDAFMKHIQVVLSIPSVYGITITVHAGNQVNTYQYGCETRDLQFAAEAIARYSE